MSQFLFPFVIGIGMPGPAEMLILLAIIMLIFGGAKLPSLMRNLGRSANEFKRGMSDSGDEDEHDEARPVSKGPVSKG